MMSVTFWCPEAPRRTVTKPCDFPGCVPGNRCGYCDDGVESERVSDAPEFNLCNGNARAILGLVGLAAMPEPIEWTLHPSTSENETALPIFTGGELYGELTLDQMATIRQRLLVLLNSAKRRAPGIREGVELMGEERVETVTEGNVVHVEVIPASPRLIVGELSDEMIVTRLEMFDRLLAWGQNHLLMVSWG
jgi:hypothetical protein